MEITTKGIMQQELPVFIEFDSISHEQFIAWYAAHANHVEKELLRVGAVFIRGVDIDQMEKFNRVMQAINPTRTHYLDGNSPGKSTPTTYTTRPSTTAWQNSPAHGVLVFKPLALKAFLLLHPARPHRRRHAGGRLPSSAG
jgi:hypothetical protein